MKVETKPEKACKVSIYVEGSPKETENEYKQVLKTFMREGVISGFRKGKAPKDVILNTFGTEINKETENRLCRTMYKKAVDEADVKMVNILDLKDVKFSPETGISFVLEVDVEPEFKLPKYKGIAVKPQTPAVTEEDVDEYMERMRSAFAKFEEADEDYEVCGNDLVCIDFQGTADDKPVKEVAPGTERMSEGTDFWVQADEQQFVPQVVSALIGLKAGTDKTVKFKFPKSAPVEALRGRKAVYDIKLKAVRKRIVPADEELCEQLKADSLEAFREEAKAKMLENAEQNEQKRCREAVTEYLLKRASFDIPESELSESMRNILDQMLREAQMRGMSSEDLASQRDEVLRSASDSAANQVRMKYMIRKIAAKEGISASHEDVKAKVESMAKEFNMTPGEIRKRLAENENENVLNEQVVFDKTIDFLLAEAK
ncbi:MAG: trigger factor [Kiritimatiellia bacterium]